MGCLRRGNVSVCWRSVRHSEGWSTGGEFLISWNTSGAEAVTAISSRGQSKDAAAAAAYVFRAVPPFASHCEGLERNGDGRGARIEKSEWWPLPAESRVRRRRCPRCWMRERVISVAKMVRVVDTENVLLFHLTSGLHLQGRDHISN